MRFTGITLQNAYDNLTALLNEAGHPEATWRRDINVTDEDEHFAFRAKLRGWNHEVSILMPGCPLATLQGQRLLAPRIYIEGNTWWWQFAVSILRDGAKRHDAEHGIRPAD